jgi:hypothetical protein
MPVAVEFTFDGGTLDQYDEIMDLMGLTNGGPTPPGALFHWCAKTDSGLRIVDVWDSREEFDKFAQEKIGPFSAKVGVPEPSLVFHDVHSYVIRGS